MTGWLIYDRAQYEKNEWFAGELLSRSRSLGIHLSLIIVQSLTFGVEDERVAFRYNGEVVCLPDFAICRSIYPLLSAALEGAGVRMFNKAAVCDICNDKRKTHIALSGRGIPMLDTVFFDRRFFAPSSVSVYPAVVKSSSGHGGTEVFLVRTERELTDAVASLPCDRFLVQRVCPSAGRDIRVYVMGGEILCAVMRSSEGFRSNYSLGGTAELYELSAAERECVRAVIQALGITLDFVGIDFLPDKAALYFNEIEDCVGSRMLYSLTDMDVAEVFLGYIKKAMASE